MGETMIRVTQLPQDLRPVPVYSADHPPEPIDCEWLAISRVADDPGAGRETFVLYFLDGGGVPGAVLQFDTLEIALDQAVDITGYPRDGWVRCELPVTEDHFEVEQLESIVAP